MPDIVEQHIDAAVKLAQARRVAEAAALLADLAERHPTHPGIPAAMGVVSLARQDPARALDFFASAVALDPRNADLLGNLVSTYRVLNRTQEAMDCLDRAIMFEPQRADFRLTRADLRMVEGDAAGAMADLERALQLGADDPEVHLVAGVILVSIGEHEGAERAFRRTLLLAPENLAASHNLAELLDRVGRYEEALLHAEKAYLGAPTEVELTHGYCRRLAAVGRHQDALKVAKRLLSALPQDLATNEIVAEMQVHLGETAVALASMGALARRRGSDVDSLVALARLLDLAGRPDDAILAAREAVTKQPDNARARILHRELLTAQGRFAEALEPPPDAEADVHPGVILVDPQFNALEAVVLARWLPRLADRYGPLVVDCPPELGCLFEGQRGCALGRSGDMADRATVLLGTVPMLVGIGDDPAIEAIPYLTPDPVELVRWQYALAEFPGPRIGVVWNRYPPGVEMAALSKAVEGVGTPVSLAIGAARKQLRAWPAAIDAGVRIDGPRDLIAAVAALDVVVGIDGMAVHVAGALGKDAFVLTPVQRPWYWLATDGRARFYPSVRVVQQRAPGRWDDALNQLRELLVAWAGEPAERQSPDAATLVTPAAAPAAPDTPSST
jgi:tetratricopeptide (TPR) repeat protein